MSDTIWPISQLPTPCDFGPFAGGYCGKVVTIDFNQASSQIDIADITIELFETATMNLKLSDLVTSAMPLDWTKTSFSPILTGNRTFDSVTTIVSYKPDETSSVNRTITFNYTVTDSLGVQATGLITINVLDKTPVLLAGNVSLSGTEGQVYNVDVRTYVTTTNTTINYADTSAVIISTQPSEGTATVSNGVITFTPSQTPATSRTITFKYKVTDLTGIQSEGTINIALTDITPAITTNNITKNVIDNVNLTGSILSNITLKNDTFSSLSFGICSEGTIVATGSNYTYTPDVNVSTPTRTVTIQYTVTTTSGLTSTSNLIVNITDFNKWNNTFWYGNSKLALITQTEIETNLTSSTKTTYVGTYNLTSGVLVYKWFVYPKSWGITPTILDASTLMEISIDEPIYLTVNGIELICIRTYYQVNGAINIKFI